MLRTLLGIAGGSDDAPGGHAGGAPSVDFTAFVARVVDAQRKLNVHHGAAPAACDDDDAWVPGPMRAQPRYGGKESGASMSGGAPDALPRTPVAAGGPLASVAPSGEPAFPAGVTRQVSAGSLMAGLRVHTPAETPKPRSPVGTLCSARMVRARVTASVLARQILLAARRCPSLRRPRSRSGPWTCPASARTAAAGASLTSSECRRVVAMRRVVMAASALRTYLGLGRLPLPLQQGLLRAVVLLGTVVAQCAWLFCLDRSSRAGLCSVGLFFGGDDTPDGGALSRSGGSGGDALTRLLYALPDCSFALAATVVAPGPPSRRRSSVNRGIF